MTLVTRISGFALVASLLGTMAVAAPHDRADMFEQLDMDGNGQITQADLDAARQARFDAIDADANGTLTADELVAYEQAREEQRRMDRAERMIERMDQDDDGLISASEMAPAERTQAPKGFIERMDADGDGVVTQDEFADFKPRDKGPRGDRHGHEGRGGHRMGPAER